MFFWNSYGLQDAMSPIMEEFIFFHDFTIIILIYATVIVGGVILGLTRLP